MRRTMLALAGCALLALVNVSAADDQWPQFRGTNAGSVADDPNLPDSWSETENVLWKTDIPGSGWSSPIVWNDHIFVTATIGNASEPTPRKGLYDPGDENGKTKSESAHRWMVYDVDFNTGKIRWQQEML